MVKFTKQPGEKLAYDIDFRDWFEQIPRDDIETATCVVVSASGDADKDDLTVNNVILIGSVPENPLAPVYVVKVWTSGGLHGVTYKLTLTIETEEGRVKELDFQIKVKEI